MKNEERPKIKINTDKEDGLWLWILMCIVLLFAGIITVKFDLFIF